MAKPRIGSRLTPLGWGFFRSIPIRGYPYTRIITRPHLAGGHPRFRLGTHLRTLSRGHSSRMGLQSSAAWASTYMDWAATSVELVVHSSRMGFQDSAAWVSTYMDWAATSVELDAHSSRMGLQSSAAWASTYMDWAATSVELAAHSSRMGIQSSAAWVSTSAQILVVQLHRIWTSNCVHFGCPYCASIMGVQNGLPFCGRSWTSNNGRAWAPNNGRPLWTDSGRPSWTSVVPPELRVHATCPHRVQTSKQGRTYFTRLSACPSSIKRYFLPVGKKIFLIKKSLSKVCKSAFCVFPLHCPSRLDGNRAKLMDSDL